MLLVGPRNQPDATKVLMTDGAMAIKVRRRHWLGPDASENVELAQLRADGYAPAPEDGSGRGGAPAAAQTPARRPERRRSSIDFPDDDPFMSPDCLRMGD